MSPGARPARRRPTGRRRRRCRRTGGGGRRGRRRPAPGTRGSPADASRRATSPSSARRRTSRGGSGRRRPRPGSCCPARCRRGCRRARGRRSRRCRPAAGRRRCRCRRTRCRRPPRGRARGAGRRRWRAVTSPSGSPVPPGLVYVTSVARFPLGPAANRRSPSAPVGWTPVSLTIGIVGLPNVGKSTLFNALTKNDVLAANYPFATIEPNVGVVGLPDERLTVLAELFSSEKVIPAPVSFVDIAGLVRGASEGEGLGNKFLANIRDASAICQVVRAFSDPNVLHVDGKVSPADDIETINTELILADLQTVEKALPRLEKESRKDKSLAASLAAAREAQTALEAGT